MPDGIPVANVGPLPSTQHRNVILMSNVSSLLVIRYWSNASRLPKCHARWHPHQPDEKGPTLTPYNVRSGSHVGIIRIQQFQIGRFEIRRSWGSCCSSVSNHTPDWGRGWEPSLADAGPSCWNGLPHDLSVIFPSLSSQQSHTSNLNSDFFKLISNFCWYHLASSWQTNSLPFFSPDLHSTSAAELGSISACYCS